MTESYRSRATVASTPSTTGGVTRDPIEDSPFVQGYNVGQVDGYAEGWAAGYQAGHESGFRKGEGAGWQKAWNATREYYRNRDAAKAYDTSREGEQ